MCEIVLLNLGVFNRASINIDYTVVASYIIELSDYLFLSI